MLSLQLARSFGFAFHFSAFCRNPVTKTWCLFNDSRASPISEDEVVTRAAYLLFYKKRSTSTKSGFDSQHESKPSSSGTDGIPNGNDGGHHNCPGDLHAADVVPADVDPDLGRDPKNQTSSVRFGPPVPPPSAFKRSNQGFQPAPTTGPVTIPLSSVESRPWLVSLLEERRRLHGLSHTITQTDTGSHRISRAITSHSLDDLLDGDCDESREDDYRGVPVYTTLHPPPRIKKYQAKPPMATISTDSVPAAAVGEGRSEAVESSSGSSPEKNSGECVTSIDAKQTESNLPTSGILRESDTRCPAARPSNSASKLNGDSKLHPSHSQDKFSHVSNAAWQQGPVKLNQTFVRQRFLEGID